MEPIGRNHVREEVRGRTALPHLAGAIGLVGTDVRGFVAGKPCRFVDGIGTRMDAAEIGERKLAESRTRRAVEALRSTLEMFTEALPVHRRHSARMLLMREILAIHRKEGTTPSDAALAIARELGLKWHG